MGDHFKELLVEGGGGGGVYCVSDGEAIARAAGKGVVRTAEERVVASAVEGVVNSEEAKEWLPLASSSIIESKNVEFIWTTIN